MPHATLDFDRLMQALMYCIHISDNFYPSQSRPLRPEPPPRASMESTVTPAPTATRQQSVSPVPSKFEDEVEPTTRSVTTGEIVRPKIRFDSPSVFFKTLWARFVSIWTKRFILSLLAGQVVSLCITCTNVTTTELVNRGWALSTTQTFFL